jgi:twitching motility protein PilT
MVEALLDAEQRERLATQRSLDFSRGVAGLSRFRFNVYYQRDALAIAVRRISHEVPPFEQLGLPPVVLDLAVRPHGLVLITGPAGSGKSTTLAAMIHHINRTRRVHVVCLEDPIEYLHGHGQSVIDQREIGADALSFAEGLRSVFRQSPDVIMVGEMRDLETMQLALSLAETGHLILATLHTQDATHAVNRIVDAFPPAQQQQVYTQLSLVLLGVVSQQLLPSKDGTRRVLACEVMNVNNAIRNLIREMQVQQIYSVIQTGRADAMVTMNDSLRSLCAAGAIDRETALRASPRPQELLRALPAGA